MNKAYIAITIAADLARALHANDLNFNVFALLSALHDPNPTRKSIIALTTETGLTYWTIHKHIHRTNFFTLHRDKPLLEVTPSTEATQKLRQVLKSLRIPPP